MSLLKIVNIVDDIKEIWLNDGEEEAAIYILHIIDMWPEYKKEILAELLTDIYDNF